MRNRRWIGFLAAVLLATGCVSHDTAIRLTEEVGEVSESAQATTTALKTAAELEVKAHADVRAALDEAFKQYFELRVEYAKAQMHARYYETREKIAAARAASLKRLADSRGAAWKSVEEAIQAGFAPVEKQEAGIEELAKSAQEKADKFPNEVPLQKAAAEARSRYFAFAAVARDKELKAVRSALANLDRAFAEAVVEVDSTATEESAKADKLLKDALLNLKTPVQSLDLGPAPTVSNEAFDAVIAYTQEVKKAQEALKKWLEASDLRPSKNVLLKDFVSGFGKGFKEVVVKGDPQAAPQWNEVVSEYRELIASGKQALAEELGNLERQAKDVMRDVAEEARDIAIEKVKAALPKEVKVD